LIAEVQAANDDGGLWGEVALEIRCAAFLRDVRLHAAFSGESARLHATGDVIGASNQPLELYIILDRFTVGYQTVNPECASFRIDSEDLPPERWRLVTGETHGIHAVRVELVHAGVTWYTFEQAFEFRPGSN